MGGNKSLIKVLNEKPVFPDISKVSSGLCTKRVDWLILLGRSSLGGLPFEK